MSGCRQRFLEALRTALRGLPAELVDGTLEDYSTHFHEGLAAGRTEQQIANALGDPRLLAEQIRLEVDVSAWERSRSPRTGWRLVAGGLGRLGRSLAGATLGLCAVLVATVACLATFGAIATGIWLLADAENLELPGGPGTVWLAALGMFTAALSIGAAATVGIASIVNRLAARTRRDLPTPEVTRTPA